MTPKDTSVHFITLMNNKLELHKYLMKLCYNSLLFPFFHLNSYYPIVTTAIYACFRYNTAVPYCEMRG
jgi:hypothetical protein